MVVCLAHNPTFSQSKEVLTNDHVVAMVKLGMGEDLIIEKIRQSSTNFDTSLNALGKLKNARVSDKIIMAMMNPTAGPATSRESPGSENNRNGNGRPSGSDDAGPAALREITEPGIYLYEAGKMTAIEPSVFSGTKANFLKGALTYGIMKSKMRAKVRGKSANLQSSSSQPVFYFVFNPDYKNSGATMAGGLWWGMPATSPAEFMMVQMSVKQASREAVMGEYGTFTGMSTGARDKDIREYSFEKIKPGVYKVVPRNVLQPGEYCFYYAGNVAGLGLAGGKVFDFSISN